MSRSLKIRRCSVPGDLIAIEQVVSRAVVDSYGHLLSDYRFDPTEDWPSSWVAEIDGNIVGVMLTGEDWVEDLWIANSHRQLGIGAQLLAIAESEILGRGYEVGHLRVVSENARALKFYAQHGWAEDRRYPHETNGFEMADLTKRLVASAP